MKTWMNTKEAAETLEIQREQLLKLRKDGTLKIGKHYRIISRSQSARPSYQWHIANIQKFLNEPLEKR